ncbi:hypothetical protein [Lyticum sinuosum]|uniref:Uncharacterized protein n=1 Tax=Lyticum sinuosum TaxID=1332059 RepID=A0AAE4VLL5_9RICK|nr:hypothetical protein [Lyticum sinuosum]MDZ5761066.1 hypothetical protein [Lyticum sinuosum]
MFFNLPKIVSYSEINSILKNIFDNIDITNESWKYNYYFYENYSECAMYVILPDWMVDNINLEQQDLNYNNSNNYKEFEDYTNLELSNNNLNNIKNKISNQEVKRKLYFINYSDFLLKKEYLLDKLFPNNNFNINKYNYKIATEDDEKIAIAQALLIIENDNLNKIKERLKEEIIHFCDEEFLSYDRDIEINHDEINEIRLFLKEFYSDIRNFNDYDYNIEFISFTTNSRLKQAIMVADKILNQQNLVFSAKYKWDVFHKFFSSSQNSKFSHKSNSFEEKLVPKFCFISDPLCSNLSFALQELVCNSSMNFIFLFWGLNHSIINMINEDRILSSNIRKWKSSNIGFFLNSQYKFKYKSIPYLQIYNWFVIDNNNIFLDKIEDLSISPYHRDNNLKMRYNYEMFITSNNIFDNNYDYLNIIKFLPESNSIISYLSNAFSYILEYSKNTIISINSVTFVVQKRKEDFNKYILYFIEDNKELFNKSDEIYSDDIQKTKYHKLDDFLSCFFSIIKSPIQYISFLYKKIKLLYNNDKKIDNTKIDQLNNLEIITDEENKHLLNFLHILYTYSNYNRYLLDIINKIDLNKNFNIYNYWQDLVISEISEEEDKYQKDIAIFLINQLIDFKSKIIFFISNIYLNNELFDRNSIIQLSYIHINYIKELMTKLNFFFEDFRMNNNGKLYINDNDNFNFDDVIFYLEKINNLINNYYFDINSDLISENFIVFYKFFVEFTFNKISNKIDNNFSPNLNISINNYNIDNKKIDNKKININILTIEEFLLNNPENSSGFNYNNNINNDINYTNNLIFYCDSSEFTKNKTIQIQQIDNIIIWMLSYNNLYINKCKNNIPLQFFCQKNNINTEILYNKENNVEKKDETPPASVSPPFSMRPLYFNYYSISKLILNPYLYYVENILQIKSSNIDNHKYIFNKTLKIAISETNSYLIDCINLFHEKQNSLKIYNSNFITKDIDNNTDYSNNYLKLNEIENPINIITNDSIESINDCLEETYINYINSLETNFYLLLEKSTKYVYFTWREKIRNIGKWILLIEENFLRDFKIQKSLVEQKFSWKFDIIVPNNIIRKSDEEFNNEDYFANKYFNNNLENKNLINNLENNDHSTIPFKIYGYVDRVDYIINSDKNEIIFTKYKNNNVKKSEIVEQLSLAVITMFSGDLTAIENANVKLRILEIDYQDFPVVKEIYVKKPLYKSLIYKISKLLKIYYGVVKILWGIEESLYKDQDKDNEMDGNIGLYNDFSYNMTDNLWKDGYLLLT